MCDPVGWANKWVGRSVNVDNSRDVRKNLGNTHYQIWALPFCPGWITWAQVVYGSILKLRITCTQVSCVMLSLHAQHSICNMVQCRDQDLSLYLSPSPSLVFMSTGALLAAAATPFKEQVMHSHPLFESLTLLLTSNIEC